MPHHSSAHAPPPTLPIPPPTQAIKNSSLTVTDIASAYQLIPIAQPPTTGLVLPAVRTHNDPPPPPQTTLRLAGADIPLDLLERALRQEDLIPALSLEPAADEPSPPISPPEWGPHHLRFVRASGCAVVGGGLLEWLPSGLLRRWLGGRLPLAAPLVRRAAINPLWQVVPSYRVTTAEVGVHMEAKGAGRGFCGQGRGSLPAGVGWGGE